MNDELKRQLLDVMVDVSRSEDDVQVTVDYSGRFMYGKRCVGIVIGRDMNLAYLAAVLVEQAVYLENAELLDELIKLLRDSRQDSMGMGTIIYFPRFQMEDVEDEVEEEVIEEDVYPPDGRE